MPVQKEPRPPRNQGRPLMFQTPRELRRKIDRYFASCWEEVWDCIKSKDGSDDQWVQRFDRHGNPMMQLGERPTITGLAIALETSRATLMDYEQRSEFYLDIRRAKDLCEYYYEQGAVKGTIHPSVAIFGLKNFGWKDKIEVVSTPELESLDINEVKSHLKRLRESKKN